ncbi:MAG: transposase [Bacillaceae bacterium]|nr:transposase [Bacillaceae bacterium]
MYQSVSDRSKNWRNTKDKTNTRTSDPKNWTNKKKPWDYYCIVTSEIDKTDEEIIASYHRLSRIEDSFRVLKSNLDARPVFVWNKQRIKAHFLVCFIALTIVRIIQHYVQQHKGLDTLNLDRWEAGITAERLQEALLSHQVATDVNGVCLFNKRCDDLKLVYEALGVKEEYSRYTIDEVSAFKRSINKLNII